MEVGITAFRCIQNKNKYEANRYTFYVFPRSFAFIDNTFMCQASSLEFLCQHNFDFNKVRNVIYLKKYLDFIETTLICMQNFLHSLHLLLDQITEVATC